MIEEDEFLLWLHRSLEWLKRRWSTGSSCSTSRFSFLYLSYQKCCHLQFYRSRHELCLNYFFQWLLPIGQLLDNYCGTKPFWCSCSVLYEPLYKTESTGQTFIVFMLSWITVPSVPFLCAYEECSVNFILC